MTDDDTYHDKPRGYPSLVWELRWVLYAGFAIASGFVAFMFALIIIHAHVIPIEMVAEAAESTGTVIGEDGMLVYYAPFIVYVAMFFASVKMYVDNKPF